MACSLHRNAQRPSRTGPFRAGITTGPRCVRNRDISFSRRRLGAARDARGQGARRRAYRLPLGEPDGQECSCSEAAMLCGGRHAKVIAAVLPTPAGRDPLGRSTMGAGALAGRQRPSHARSSAANRRPASECGDHSIGRGVSRFTATHPTSTRCPRGARGAVPGQATSSGDPRIRRLHGRKGECSHWCRRRRNSWTRQPALARRLCGR